MPAEMVAPGTKPLETGPPPPAHTLPSANETDIIDNGVYDERPWEDGEGYSEMILFVRCNSVCTRQRHLVHTLPT